MPRRPSSRVERRNATDNLISDSVQGGASLAVPNKANTARAKRLFGITFSPGEGASPGNGCGELGPNAANRREKTDR